MMTWMWKSLTVSSVLKTLWQTFRGAGVVDYFDVAAVTFLIYLALRWIHRSRAARVVQGILIVTVLYAVAIQSHLALTTSLFRGLLTVVMLSLMSLFQEDLRRFFERITVYRHDPMHRRMFRPLLRSVRHFSKHHIGALIVLKGRDPLDRHLEGGQVLNGRMSSALLESLFDPHSLGHDGAVIIDGEEVKRFGVHLPLSKHLDHETGLGTRHAAALGISELSDAFCLVVSETHGSVMIARDGRLANMGDGQGLEKRLADYLRERFQAPAAKLSWRLVSGHPVEKGLSLVLGLALWLVFVKGIRPAERFLSLPVHVARLPKGVEMEAVFPAKAMVTLRGLERDLHALPANLDITLEAPRSTRPRQRLALGSGQVHVPAHVSVTAVSPDFVFLRLKSVKIHAAARPPLPAPKRSWFQFHGPQ